MALCGISMNKCCINVIRNMKYSLLIEKSCFLSVNVLRHCINMKYYSVVLYKQFIWSNNHPFVRSLCTNSTLFFRTVIPCTVSTFKAMCTSKLVHKALTNFKCWKCGKNLHPDKGVFFCICGVVQQPATFMSYFKLFNFVEHFDVDTDKLSDLHKTLLKDLHPDKYSNRSQKELALAQQQSALLNEAYSTLLKPLPRSIYILKLNGHWSEEEGVKLNPEFLAEMLELNECISNATVSGITDIKANIAKNIEDCVQSLSVAYNAGKYAQAKDFTVRLKFFSNIETRIQKFYRDLM